jgi:RNA polymerase sigma-70 factor, ECF subfamily
MTTTTQDISAPPSADREPAALLQAVHDAHRQALSRYVLRISGGDSAFAEDVVQETLLRLWRNPEVLRSSEGIRGWLYTVARNLVIDDRRSARYSRELRHGDVPERPSQDTMGQASDRMVLSDALSTLSAEHRAVVVRAHYLGQSVAEIALQEHIPEGTVKSRLHYALHAMRIALQENDVAR